MKRDDNVIEPRGFARRADREDFEKALSMTLRHIKSSSGTRNSAIGMSVAGVAIACGLIAIAVAILQSEPEMPANMDHLSTANFVKTREFLAAMHNPQMATVGFGVTLLINEPGFSDGTVDSRLLQRAVRVVFWKESLWHWGLSTEDMNFGPTDNGRVASNGFPTIEQAIADARDPANHQ